MPDRYDYEDRERRQGRRDDEGFFNRVRDWFNGPEDEDYDYDESTHRARAMNRDNWQRGQNYDRSQQWRGSRPGSDYDRRPEYYQNRDRDAFGDPYGQNYGSEDYDWDYGYSRQYNRGEDFGRNYNRGNQDFNRGYNRDYGYDQERFNNRDTNQGRRSGQIYNRDWYDWDFDEDFNDENDNIRNSGYNRDSGYSRNSGYNRGGGYNRNFDYNRNRGSMRDSGPRERFNRGTDDYNQFRDYGRVSDLRSVRTYNRGSDYNRSRDYDRDRDYNRNRDYNRDRDYHLYGLDYGPDRDSERSREYNRGFNRGNLYGLQNIPSRVNYKYGGREDQDWSNRYRTAGMNSDYGQRSDYDNRAFYDENLDFYRGDIGYDNEGAFYQDLDEPINYEYWEFWEVPGPYSGVGPQNFQRSDKRIKEDVCERFTNHGRIDPSDIDIDVNDGEVTLRGTVPDRKMKRLAEDTAENIIGVKNIRNEIKVDKPEWSQRDYNRSSEREYDRYRSRAEMGMAGQTNAGSGLTTEGATSLSGMEAATGEDRKRSQLREGMEVISNTGQVIGRVKEIRASDFLVDREMARDLYVPFSAIKTVGAQVLLNVAHDQVDQQGWDKPGVL